MTFQEPSTLRACHTRVSRLSPVITCRPSCVLDSDSQTATEQLGRHLVMILIAEWLICAFSLEQRVEYCTFWSARSQVAHCLVMTHLRSQQCVQRVSASTCEECQRSMESCLEVRWIGSRPRFQDLVKAAIYKVGSITMLRDESPTVS